MRPRVTQGFVLFTVTLLIYLASVNGVWATDHATSFVQLDYALWKNHTVALGNVSTFQPGTVDDFAFRGKFYSALAPGSAILAFPFLAVAFWVEGGYTLFGTVLLFSEAFVALAGALAAYFTYRIAAMIFRKSTALLIGFALSFSSISWPFATFFFQSDVSAMLVTLAAFLGLNAVKSEKRRTLGQAACGFAVGTAFTVDYVNAVLVPIFVVFFVLAGRRKLGSGLRSIGAFLLGALPGFIGIGAYNWIAFGSPLMTSEQAYLPNGSVFGSFTTPVYSGLALDIFSPARGLLIFVPFAVLGILGLILGVRAPSLKQPFLLFVAIFLGILLPYSMWYNPDGGVSYGPRFIVAAVPFILLPAGVVIEQARGRKVLLVYFLFVAGVVTNGMAALVTAIPEYLGPRVSPFLAIVLPNFFAGKLDAFWAANAGTYLTEGVANILAAASAIPLLLTRMEIRAEKRETPTEAS